MSEERDRLRSYIVGAGEALDEGDAKLADAMLTQALAALDSLAAELVDVRDEEWRGEPLFLECPGCSKKVSDLSALFTGGLAPMRCSDCLVELRRLAEVSVMHELSDDDGIPDGVCPECGEPECEGAK